MADTIPAEAPTRSVFDPWESYVAKITSSTRVRFYQRAYYGYAVQIIYNCGVTDRRLKGWKRERRVHVAKDLSRADAARLFEREVARLRRLQEA